MSRSHCGRLLGLGIPLVLMFALVGCVNRPIEKPSSGTEGELPQYFPQSIEKDIDILFVIDNSNSMGEEQENLARNFPNFIEALRSPKLGSDGSGQCDENNVSGCKIPNVRIGAITTDLGAGNFGTGSCEKPGGDGGKLQSQARVAGCTPPSQPWIEYTDGRTNVPASGSAVEQVKEAFQCIARFGTGGCGFEHQLEAARRALDPQRSPNAGFLRPDAYLAVVFITDEDDCSAQKLQLFDTSQGGQDDPLGPVDSFRCFEFGTRCNINDRHVLGLRQDCRPALDWLYPVDSYVSFFKGLKPPGRVLMFAIAGPLTRFEVGMDGQKFALMPSCEGTNGKAVPALRLKTVIDAFGKQGHFNEGVDVSGTHSMPVDICASDFAPALRLLGKVIVANLGGQCISLPPLTRSGGLVCDAGRDLGGVKCRQGCLDQADCAVTQVTYEGTSQEKTQEIPKCDASKFNNPGDKDCRPNCPCWRITPKEGCKPSTDGSPYGLEILRENNAEAPKGTMAVTKCNIASEAWGTPKFAAMPQCNEAETASGS